MYKSVRYPNQSRLKMAEYIHVVRRALGQLGGHGGVKGLFVQLFRANDVKTGALIGVDKYGNKYFEDTRYFFGRHRWVIYTTEMNGKNTMWEVDGSMVPAEWHRWLHCMTDNPPTTHPPTPKKFLAEVHQFNVSGSAQAYVPYSTTRKKIHEWVPPKAQ
uniref:NADH dehydrogenase [ubiquinone] 1 alpha subcomplex subunit 12-like n=1 Tax=Oncorhynchus gorbuscha TaxID=8017 RepID=UPI001EAEEE19|nr:NADH dehydrogenase [ubiquinone] 1 alpha subcomplex subunit 12-like [Oncorhynchus gorbuscha]